MFKDHFTQSQENILTAIRCNMNQRESSAFDRYLVLKDNNLPVAPSLCRELEDILKKVKQM